MEAEILCTCEECRENGSNSDLQPADMTLQIADMKRHFAYMTLQPTGMTLHRADMKRHRANMTLQPADMKRQPPI